MAKPGATYLADPATCFTDLAGTTPCGDGDAVALCRDLSGGGRHLRQPTAGSRPTLVRDADGGWSVHQTAGQLLETAAAYPAAAAQTLGVRWWWDGNFAASGMGLSSDGSLTAGGVVAGSDFADPTKARTAVAGAAAVKAGAAGSLPTAVWLTQQAAVGGGLAYLRVNGSEATGASGAAGGTATFRTNDPFRGGTTWAGRWRQIAWFPRLLSGPGRALLDTRLAALAYRPGLDFSDPFNSMYLGGGF